MIVYEERAFGFMWGPLQVIRYGCDKKKGWVSLGIKTAKCDLTVVVDDAGEVTIYWGDKEAVMNRLTKGDKP
jgi:hypothetical protein